MSSAKFRRLTIASLVVVAAAAAGSHSASAGTISGVGVTNSSSPSEDLGSAFFDTQASVGAVMDAGLVSSFDFRMAALNEFTGNGGVAQVHRRNIIFDLAFTVQDPTNAGFTLSVDSLLRGVSSITQTTADSTAVATGVSFGVEIDDTTDAPDTFSNVVPLFTNTDNAQVDGIGTVTLSDEDLKSVDLGAFVGTTGFILRYSTVFTPTTNVFFQNNQAGNGSVNYGLADPPAGLGLTAEDLGLFLTVEAVFNESAVAIPEPATIGLLGLGLFGLARRRGRGE